jgi:hypothetical protein
MSSEVILRRRLPAAARKRKIKINDSYLLALGDELVSRYVEAKPRERERERLKAANVRRERRAADYAREISNLLFGCELLIALAE